jgi:hypothetical protein
MNDFGVLNNRKRALIALVHSVVFLGIAMRGFTSLKAGVLPHGSGSTSDFILIGIYLTVASILAWLVSVARCARERIYFAFCACSGLHRSSTSRTAENPMRVISRLPLKPRKCRSMRNFIP